MYIIDKNQLPLTVGILIFDQVEVLDVAGPFKVFAVTRLDEERRQEESSPFRVLLVSENKDQVSAIGGLRFTPDVTKDNCPELDLPQEQITQFRLEYWRLQNQDKLESLYMVTKGKVSHPINTKKETAMAT